MVTLTVVAPGLSTLSRVALVTDDHTLALLPSSMALLVMSTLLLSLITCPLKITIRKKHCPTCISTRLSQQVMTEFKRKRNGSIRQVNDIII